MGKNENPLEKGTKSNYFDMNLIRKYSKEEYHKIVDSYRKTEKKEEEKYK